MSSSGGWLEQASSYFDSLPAWGKTAVAGGAALVVYLPFRYLTTRQRKSLAKPDWEPGVVYLYQFPRTKNVPSFSPFCLKLETWLRIADIRYEIPPWNARIWSKEGTLPFVELDSVEYYDSAFAIRDLTAALGKQGLEEHLSEEQKAVSRSFEALAEKSLLHTTLVSRYENVDKLMEMVNPKMLGIFGPILKKIMAYTFSLKMAKKLALSDLGPHSREDRIAIGVDDLRAISKYLGTKHYFTGFKPTRVDACIFSVLAQIAFAPYESEHLTVIRDECPNLLEYMERIKTRFWPDWGDATAKFSTDTNWKKRPRAVNGSGNTPTSSLASPLGRS